MVIHIPFSHHLSTYFADPLSLSFCLYMIFEIWVCISSLMGSLETARRTSQEASHKKVARSTHASQTPEFKSWLHYLLGQWLGTCCFTSLCLSFHSCQMGVIGKYHVHRVTGRLHEVLSVKLLGQLLALGKHYDSICHCWEIVCCTCDSFATSQVVRKAENILETGE